MLGWGEQERSTAIQQIKFDRCHDGHRHPQVHISSRRLDRRGAILLRPRWSRGQIEARLANMPPCLIGMEACVGAHHLSRRLTSLGHGARLMPAKYVRPYSRGQKNDFRDAEAIAHGFAARPATPKPWLCAPKRHIAIF